MTHPQDTPANPAQGVREALSDCLDMLARFTHSTSNDLNHVEARAVYRAGRAALAAIDTAPKPPGWPDPLESPQAEAIRNGKLDDTEIRNLFDCMERELRLHRERAANPAREVSGQDNSGDAIVSLNDYATDLTAAIGAGVAAGPISETAPVLPKWGGQAVAVMALEWRKGYCDETVTIQQASFGGLYQVRILDGVIWLDWPDRRDAVEFSSVEAAKAAAQADYERRIKSALAHPVQPGWRDIAEDQPAPPHDTPVLLWSPPSLSRPNGEYEARPFSTGRSGPGWSEYSQHSWATHWMPLPAAPQPKGE